MKAVDLVKTKNYHIEIRYTDRWSVTLHNENKYLVDGVRIAKDWDLDKALFQLLGTEVENAER